MQSVYSKWTNSGICSSPRGEAALSFCFPFYCFVGLWSLILSLQQHFDLLSLLCTVSPCFATNSCLFSPQLILWPDVSCVFSMFFLLCLRNWCTLCLSSINLLLAQIHVSRFDFPSARWYDTWLQAVFKPRMQRPQPPFSIKPTKSDIKLDEAPWESCHDRSSSKVELIEQNHRSQVGPDLPGWKACCHQRSQYLLRYMVTNWLRGLWQVERTFFLFNNKVRAKTTKRLRSFFNVQIPLLPKQNNPPPKKNWTNQNQNKTELSISRTKCSEE